MSERTAKILERAYHLLDDKKRWTTGVSAEDENFCEVNPESDYACRWCAVGAIEKFSKTNEESAAALSSMRRYTVQEVHRVNDRHDGYRKVRAAFRKAIKAELAQ